MPFAEDQDMIQAVAPKCPDQAQHMDSAMAISVMSGGPESPSPGLGSARRRHHCRAPNRSAPCSTGMPRRKGQEFFLSRDDWRSTLGATAIRARRMQKDQLLAEHTIPPSHSGRQASSRRPCCHKESAVASGQPNLSGRELTERHRRLCVSETSLSAPPIEAQGNQQACRQPCDCACGAFCHGSNLSKQTWLLSWPWPRRG
jgi:hypothetical protein